MTQTTYQEQLEKYKDLLNKLVIMAHIIDPKGVLVCVSDFWLKNMGYERHEVIGRNSLEFLSKASKTFTEKSMLPHFLENGFVENAPLQMVKKNGNIIDVLLSANSVNDSGSSFIGSIATMFDVTEYNQAEEAFKARDERHQSAQRIAKAGNWEYTPSTKKFWGSDEAKRLYGFDPGNNAITIDEVENCIPERERIHTALVDLIENDQPYNLEFEIRPITGPDKRIIKSIAEVVKDDAGIPQKAVGVIQDITARKAAEQKLRQSEQKYRLLFENIMNGFALHDVVYDTNAEIIDYIFLEINTAFEELTGLKRKDIIGKKVTEVLPGVKEDPANWIARYGDVVREGRNIRFERYSKPLGRWFSVLAFRTQQGRFATIFEDITDRKNSEEILKNSEEKYRHLFNSIKDSILVANIDRTIIDCNQALTTGFGYTKNEIIGKKTAYLYDSEEEYQEMGKRLREYSDTTTFSYGITYKKKSGEIFPGETNVHYLKNDAGEKIGFIGVIKDISYRKMVENALQKANDSLQQKSAMLKDTNTALKILLKKSERDNQELAENIFSNYEILISPFLKKLKNNASDKNQQNLFDIVEVNLEEIVAPFTKKLSNPMLSLTSSEIQIASMIKQGLTNKEIAQMLTCSKRTIDTHRENIRRKLKLKNKKINLRTFLANL